MLETPKLIIIGILCIAIGGALGFLIEWGATRVQVATMQSERDKAILEKATMQKQWEVAVNELNQTKVILKDTLSALEVLRQYKIVDKDVKDDLTKIDTTLDPQGNPTDTTYDEFRKMIEEFNQLNGNLSTSMETYAVLDIQPFEDLKTEAQKLFEDVTALVMKFKGRL